MLGDSFSIRRKAIFKKQMKARKTKLDQKAIKVCKVGSTTSDCYLSEHEM